MNGMVQEVETTVNLHNDVTLYKKLFECNFIIAISWAKNANKFTEVSIGFEDIGLFLMDEGYF